MAVVFISPKKRQRTFFVIITIAFVLLLTIISIGVFVSKPKKTSSVVVFNTSKINIDMGIFDSEKFKVLQLFPEMKFQYKYKVSSKTGPAKEGYISAESEVEARATLQKMGLNIISLEQAEIGRDNPFTPYYEVVKVVETPAPVPAPAPVP